MKVLRQGIWSHPHAISIGLGATIFVNDIDGKSANDKADSLGLTGGEPTWEVGGTPTKITEEFLF